jgi:hypothetical protein
MHHVTEQQRYNATVHSIWRALRQPFLLPESICKHTNTAASWEIYDFNAAGCLQCGIMHICMQGGACPLHKNDEGHEICTITGFCTKMLNFSEKEYMPNMNFSSSSHEHCMVGGDEDELPMDDMEDCPSRASKSRKCYDADKQPSIQTTTINKKNRYRSWVHHRIQVNVSQQQQPQQWRSRQDPITAGSSCRFLSNQHHDVNKIGSLIDTYVWDILCSSRWVESMQMEARSFFV